MAEENAFPSGNLAGEIPNLSSGWFIFLGILMVLIGTGAIIMPVIASLTVEILIGWLLISAGIVEVIRSFHSKGTRAVLWNILLALLFLAVGILLLVYPLRGVLTLTLLLAAFFMAGGILKIIIAFQLKPMGGWGWTLFSGLVGILLAVIIWSGWPGTAAWVIGLLLGIDLIFGGWSMIMMALAAKSVRKAAAGA